MLPLSGWDSASRSSHLLTQRTILTVNGAYCLVLLAAQSTPKQPVFMEKSA